MCSAGRQPWEMKMTRVPPSPASAAVGGGSGGGEGGCVAHIPRVHTLRYTYTAPLGLNTLTRTLVYLGLALECKSDPAKRVVALANVGGSGLAKAQLRFAQVAFALQTGKQLQFK